MLRRASVPGRTLKFLKVSVPKAVHFGGKDGHGNSIVLMDEGRGGGGTDANELVWELDWEDMI